MENCSLPPSDLQHLLRSTTQRAPRQHTGWWRSRRKMQGLGGLLALTNNSAQGQRLPSRIFAICCNLTRSTITRLARTFQSTRTRRRREQYMPLSHPAYAISWRTSSSVCASLISEAQVAKTKQMVFAHSLTEAQVKVVTAHLSYLE